MRSVGPDGWQRVVPTAGTGHTDGAELEAGGTLLRLWSAAWASDPTRPALVDGIDPDLALTAGQLEERTARAAGAFALRDVGPGDRVVWSCATSLESMVGLLGALRLGAVIVPVSPSATERELNNVCRDVRPAVALVDVGERRKFIVRVRDDDFCVMWTHDVDPRRKRIAIPALDTARPDDGALIVYTSGTTGQPKGAVHTHRSLLAGVQSLRLAWQWEPDDRLIHTLPLFHVHGLCAGLFGTLAAGASAVVFERFVPELVLGAVAGSTMFFGVPTMYHRLSGSGRSAELSRLRLCVSGSAPLAADLWQQLKDEAGVSVLERYGMTETLLTLSNPLVGERRPGSVGLPLPGVEAAVADADEHGIGELMVRGPSLCRGYWERPEATASMLQRGWFATGDLASVADDGYVSIRGRRTELIITGGHNVYPAEVESVLGAHPSVSEMAVVGVPSPEWGESVVAFVVGAGGPPDIEGLGAMAAELLAPFKRPREFRVVDALPRNAMGKVVRHELG
jgi:malonyl-CoA/methylmalonyl-CoA synthetase